MSCIFAMTIGPKASWETINPIFQHSWFSAMFAIVWKLFKVGFLIFVAIVPLYKAMYLQGSICAHLHLRFVPPPQTIVIPVTIRLTYLVLSRITRFKANITTNWNYLALGHNTRCCWLTFYNEVHNCYNRYQYDESEWMTWCYYWKAKKQFKILFVTSGLVVN